MLDIVIEKLSSDQGVVTITATVTKPFYIRSDLGGDENPEELKLHYKRQSDYLALHLGNAILSQARVE